MVQHRQLQHQRQVRLPWQLRRQLPRRLPLRLALLALVALALLLRSIAPANAAPTTAAPATLTLAQHYHPGVPLQHYWVSEKYDGIRAHWDGQRLLSRQGLPIDHPAWFTQGWPATPLDGELWAGRGQFAAAQSAVALGRSAEAGWRQLRYMVFDLPAHPGPFTTRQTALQSAVARIQQPWVQTAPQWQVGSHTQLQQQLRALVQAGGEGLMLRHADAPYRAGRSSDLLKAKLHDDAEATVIAHLPGQGKYHGLTGALLVQTPEGLRFKLGSGLRDADRAQPPAIGSVVTYRFNGQHPSGLPRFARYLRVHTPAPAGSAPHLSATKQP